MQFEDEMIAKLDSLVEGGRGDHQFKDLFNSLLINMSEKHSTMKTQVCQLQFNATILPIKSISRVNILSKQ